MMMWQRTGPTTRVSTPNDNDGVLAVGLEHDDGVTSGYGRNHRQTVEANTAAAKRAGNKATKSVITNLSDEVGRMGELSGARGLIGALAASKRLAGLRREGLAF